MGDLTNDVCTYSDPSSSAKLTFTCAKASLCGGLGGTSVCACNASGCGARENNIDFDLRFTGDTAEGVDTAHNGSGVRIHFTRSL